MSNDTLQINHQLLEQLQQDPRYAYSVDEQKPSLLSELFKQFGHWFARNIDSGDTLLRPITYSICTLAVMVFIWWFVRSGWAHRLFGKRQKAVAIDMEEAEQHIHEVDFDSELRRAVGQGDYARAIRLLYLQTLKRLSDAGHIDWQPQKTPTQYTLEVGSTEFRQLTYHFMCIRYGGFEADEQLYQDMLALQALVEKGGEA